MKVTVFVSPKTTVLDPQGAAVEQAIKSLGHHSIEGVRVGKTITFQMEGSDTPEIRDEIDRLCDCLLYTSPSPRDRQKSRMPSSA